MVAALPAQQVVELFNDLILTSPSDSAKLKDLVWRVRGLYRKLPNDPFVMLTLVQGLAMTGDATGAIEIADRTWGYRYRLETFEQRLALANLLVYVGLYERALEWTLQLPMDGDPLSRRLIRAALLSIAWGLGDVAKLASFSVDEGEWKNLFAELRKTGLDKHLAAHQKIVRDRVAGKQVFMQPIITGDDGRTEVATYIYVAAPYEDRLQLEEQIHDALAHYYQSCGLSPAVYIPVLTPIVLDVTAERMHTVPTKSGGAERADGPAN